METDVIMWGAALCCWTGLTVAHLIRLRKEGYVDGGVALLLGTILATAVMLVGVEAYEVWEMRGTREGVCIAFISGVVALIVEQGVIELGEK